MKHYGDITKLHGYDLPPVDCITGGSPCQDLSVAGKREGLSGERSGLFMEQIRIVKEMRERDISNGRSGQFVRPRWLVWENVPGALSSGKDENGQPCKGADFQAVLTEIVRIVEPNAPPVPMPNKGKWSKSGCIYDEMGRWSIAWRVHDAQFWGATQEVDGRVLNRGTPQRRKRIALVADFGSGEGAATVLFERNGLQGNPQTEPTERERVAGSAEESTGESDQSG